MRFILKNFDEERRRNNEDVLLRDGRQYNENSHSKTEGNNNEDELLGKRTAQPVKGIFFLVFRVNFICNADKSDYFNNLDLNLKIKVV